MVSEEAVSQDAHFDPADWIDVLGGPEAIVARLYHDSILCELCRREESE